MKYLVTVVRTGCLYIEADNEEKAMEIADHQTTDKVSWSDDWGPVDVEEDDSAEIYIDFDPVEESCRRG